MFSSVFYMERLLCFWDMIWDLQLHSSNIWSTTPAMNEKKKKKKEFMYQNLCELWLNDLLTIILVLAKISSFLGNIDIDIT
jgi:hypothetical protein